MKNFMYTSPTKLYFGKNQIESLEHELKTRDVKKLLLVYGKESIFNLGIYDTILNICKKLGIIVFEEGNVRPNPEVASVRSGIATCKKENIDFVLSAGGGSAADCAKAIAFGATTECDVWDIYLRKCDATYGIPVGVIMTLAATGSETNGNSVISNDETDEKRSVAYSFSVPQFAIIDPTYNKQVNHHHTIAGSIDIIMHTLEQYFSITERTETSDYMSFGLIKSVIENTDRILSGENSYDNRANLSWASTISLNWILGVDKVGDWATHRISYPLSQFYGITHGIALALLFPAWLERALVNNEKVMSLRLSRLGENIFGVSEPLLVIGAIRKLFSAWGAKSTFKELNIDLRIDDIERISENVVALGNVGTVYTVDQEEVKIILEMLK